MGSPQRHLRLSARLLILLGVFIALSGITAAASAISLPLSVAQSYSSQVASIPPTTGNIFLNNVQIALIEIIPGFGPVFGAYTSYETGLALSAIAETTGQGLISGLESFLVLLFTPIYWLEFFSYSLAVEESLAIIISLRNRDFLKLEWKWLIGSILTMGVVLLVSAYLEATFVGLFG